MRGPIFPIATKITAGRRPWSSYDAGHEIVKRQGYLDPQEMASMLQAIIDDPSPGPSVQAEKKSRSPRIRCGRVASHPTRKRLSRRIRRQAGQLGSDQKYLDVDSVELAIDRAAHGMRRRQAWPSKLWMLNSSCSTPVCGVYQYSTDVFGPSRTSKKSCRSAENLRIYAEAYAQFHDPKYLQAAQAIQRFLATLLTSPDGAFYTSQGRRRRRRPAQRRNILR